MTLQSWKHKHTLGGEGDRTTTVGHRGDLVDFEPDSTITSPASDIGRSFGHVDVHDLFEETLSYFLSNN
jgi:hypothetical protein